MKPYKIGIDIGGTFTDFFLWSGGGEIASYKTLSTPEDPSIGLIQGLEHIAEELSLTLEDFAGRLGTIVHGTTVTTNATLTRGGVKTGLLTTKGVRDALEMRRGIRERQYDNHYQNVEPLVPRYLRIGIEERMDASGKELTPLDDAGIREALKDFEKEGVEAVAICFLHSYANPAHEKRAESIAREELSSAYCSSSSNVLPVVRFYNRVSTTVLNAYVGPILDSYLETVTEKLASIGFAGVLLIMQSNGGVALPEVIRGVPATTLLSGPAGGPSAGAAYTRAHGSEDCIVVDMGGTSFDASLVRGGEAAMELEGEIERLRIALPMLAITTIGAGGGSIGWVDGGGLLRMGPQSAGSVPGPACYGRGGDRPTCTDANVVLGYLDPSYFAGGALPLDREAAERAITKHIAEPLGLELPAAAAGMYRVINTNMAHGVREITVKRGLDPREFPLVIAGGAGALHASMIARELEIPTLLVPRTASVLCATGMLLSDLRHDYVRSYVARFSELDFERLESLFEEMRDEGLRELATEGVDPKQAEVEAFLDLRYLKQYHEVSVRVPIEAISGRDHEAIATLFHAAHDGLYGYELSQEGTELELINVRARVTGKTDKPELPRMDKSAASVREVQKGSRPAYSPEDDAMLEMPVYDGTRMGHGAKLEGPALIEKPDTTIFVSRSYDAEVDEHGSFFLRSKEGGR